MIDYKNEFLEYLNCNNLNHYKLYSEPLPNYTTIENGLIRAINREPEALITKMSESRGINPSIHVFCVQDETVDAFCFKVDWRYYIGIHTGTYVQLIRKCNIVADFLINQSGLYRYKDKQKIRLQSVLWNYAFKMMLKHEYMHIILGHCDAMAKQSHFLWENSSQVGKIKECIYDHIDLQAFEMFADIFAVRDEIEQMMAFSKGNIEEIQYSLLSYYVSIILVYSLFAQDECEDTCHPAPGVRLYYSMAEVDDTILFYLGDNAYEKLEEIDMVVDELLYIIETLPQVLSPELLYTFKENKIDRLHLQLFNRAADIVKEINSMAIYPIEEFGKLDAKIIAQRNREREFIKFATQNDYEYDQVCELIERNKHEG